MRQAAIFIAVGLLAGIAVASWFGSSPLPMLEVDADPSDASVATVVTSDRDIAARLAELERRLAAEAERRTALEATVASLSERLGADGVVPLAADRQGGAGESSAVERNNPRQQFESRRAMIEQRNSPEFRLNRLIEAGFGPDEAQALLDRESQMRLDAMNASYAARREGGQVVPQVDMMERQREFQAELRSDFGDDKYERYLEATGQPTSVGIMNVLSNSAGEIAGLQAGDEIVSYNGERVFNVLDLRAQTIAGEPGETVTVDIVRDGQPMQLYIERGPLGINSGGFGARGAFFGPGTGNVLVVP